MVRQHYRQTCSRPTQYFDHCYPMTMTEEQYDDDSDVVVASEFEHDLFLILHSEFRIHQVRNQIHCCHDDDSRRIDDVVVRCLEAAIFFDSNQEAVLSDTHVQRMKVIPASMWELLPTSSSLYIQDSYSFDAVIFGLERYLRILVANLFKDRLTLLRMMKYCNTKEFFLLLLCVSKPLKYRGIWICAVLLMGVWKKLIGGGLIWIFSCINHY